MLKKEKYLQILNYLLEFSKIRSKPVRDIDASDTQYPVKLWLSEIPEDEGFENVVRAEFNKENDYWINVKKPKEPEKPKFNLLPEAIKLWVEPLSLLDKDNVPFLRKNIEIDGENLLLVNFPDVNSAFDRYVDGRWHKDLLEYSERLLIYQRKLDHYEKLSKVYKSIFSIYNKTQQFGDEYELVIGIGLLNFKENSQKPRIFRHILTQKVDISFDARSQISISPNIESYPQIETDSIIDLNEQFNVQNIIDAEKALTACMNDKDISQLVFDNEILEALQIFADRMSSDGHFLSSIEKPIGIHTKPTICFAPALLLRKRNTRSFTALYEKILENIENGGTDLDIPSINDLIGVRSDTEDYLSNQATEFQVSKPEPIFFPKEYNDEQIEIIEKSRRNSKVLVQGPPGTGKSHTIANLICHLLANGKKILVTAQTPRALSVLKDKLPKEFQDLTVSLLNSDSSGLNDLQKSVNEINNRLSTANLSEYQKAIKKLTEDLFILRENIAHHTNELLKIAEKATRNQDINSIYEGTMIEIAEKLETDAPKYSWYRDKYDDFSNDLLINEVQQFINLNNEYSSRDLLEFNGHIPDISKFPSVSLLTQHEGKLKELSETPDVGAKSESLKCHDFTELISLLKDLLLLYQKSNSLQIDFKTDVISSFLQGEGKWWKEKVEKSLSLIDRLEKNDLYKLDREVEVTYSSNNSLKHLKNDAQRLLQYLKEGNTLDGLPFFIKKPFLSKELKESLYLIDSIKVNGSPCDSIEEFESVIIDIDIRQDLDEISQIWGNGSFSDVQYMNQLAHFKRIVSDVTKLIRVIEDSEALCLRIEKVADFKVTKFDVLGVSEMIGRCEYNDLSSCIAEFDTTTKNLTKSFIEKDIHPIVNELLKDIRDVNPTAYEKRLELMKSLLNKKQKYKEFLELSKKIQTDLPNVLEDIFQGKFTLDNIGNLVNAFYYLHARRKIDTLMNIDYEQDMSRELQEFEKREKILLASLGSTKAWGSLIEGLHGNYELRQHLEAWMQAVTKIGKTGKGVRAAKFRKEAQKEMEICKSAVPCWIMPLYKVADTISPTQEMYDYVIIDEASQLGPDAIFLLYISKKIIIVGDDKQTSPEYVGVGAETMAPHINRHLEGIPFANYYGTEFSFFDHAKRFCDGVTVLREHFRCMPEIIEFSNKNFYAPDGKALYPLKQYSEDRLVPLQTVYCQKGYTEGIGASIINEPEANEIVEVIDRLIKNKKYDDKSFGVITLQGNQQAALIENLLLKRIGEEEFHKRKIICGNSASFQGDERDIIFLSLVTAHNHRRAIFAKPEDERRFNVAVSRAIEQIWLFHSIQIDDLSNKNDLRYKLLQHFKSPQPSPIVYNKLIKRELGKQPDPFDSWFEVDVYNDIVTRGYSVIPNYEVAGGRYRIDLVAIFADGTKIAIECDGDKWHGAEQYQNDSMRQKVLERCGWQFFRVRGSEYYTNRQKALEGLWNMFEELNFKVETRVSERTNLDNSSESLIFEEAITDNSPVKANLEELPLENQEREPKTAKRSVTDRDAMQLGILM